MIELEHIERAAIVADTLDASKRHVRDIHARDQRNQKAAL
jgi:hypothetical protein